MRWISGRNFMKQAPTVFPVKAQWKLSENDPVTAKVWILGIGDCGFLLLFKTHPVIGWPAEGREDRLRDVKELLKDVGLKYTKRMKFRWLENDDRLAPEPDLNMMISSVCTGKKYYAEELIAYAKANF